MTHISLAFLYTIGLLWHGTFGYITEECTGPRNADDIIGIIKNKNNITSAYKKRTRPNLSKLIADNPKANPFLSSPDVIRFRIKILNIKNVDQRRGEVEMLIVMYYLWNDYRLNFTSSNHCYAQKEREPMDMHDLSSFWSPRYTVLNAASKLKEMDSCFLVFPNGDVAVPKRLRLTVGCKFDFKKFPKDTQTCQIVIGAIDDVNNILFDFLSPAIEEPSDADETVSGSSNEWNIVNLRAFTSTHEVNNPKSIAVFEVDIERKSVYYEQNVILPVVMMVFICWASFFIDRGSAPARVSITTTGFLTISNFLSSELKNLPRLGAERIWLLRFMQISMAFCFYSVIEYVICNYLHRVEKRTKQARKMVMEKQQERNLSNSRFIFLQVSTQTSISKEDMVKVGLFRIDSLLISKNGTLLVKAEHIDVFSRFMYPVAYTVVCVILAKHAEQL